MARRVITIDDIDGKTEAAENVVWGLDGEWYELDLSEVNAAKMRGLLDPYKAASRPTSAPRKSRNGDDTQAMREWGIRNGFVVSDKGPIPGDLRQAYEKAQATNGGTATK
ncbi:Lsr2 family protein [Streptomyces sp. NBC_00620]|uniref:histone-like nucleoid-structuring protein Lsr2 n=1 Tax=Streptomyces sp. NBC_00620 TaxID=2903666 RepID=UPI0022559BE1|nr:Lsr2 family protein [Streptomyces sp. NBC_00620]MCX4976260.1 Lsr2 family protein [Streptomyces sp. NBC_00620]